MAIFRLLVKEFIFFINFGNYKGFGFFILAVNSKLEKDFMGKYIIGVFNTILKKGNDYIGNGLSAADFGKYTAIFVTGWSLWPTAVFRSGVRNWGSA